MKIVVKLIDPNGIEYFASEPDREGLRYCTYEMQSAEVFASKEKADLAIASLKQIRELKDYKMLVETFA